MYSLVGELLGSGYVELLLELRIRWQKNIGNFGGQAGGGTGGDEFQMCNSLIYLCGDDNVFVGSIKHGKELFHYKSRGRMTTSGRGEHKSNVTN